MKLLQVRISQKLLKRISLARAVEVSLQKYVLEEVTFSLNRKYLLIGRRAFDFGRQWKTVQLQFEKRERIRYHLMIPEELFIGAGE